MRGGRGAGGPECGAWWSPLSIAAVYTSRASPRHGHGCGRLDVCLLSATTHKGIAATAKTVHGDGERGGLY